MSEPQHKYKKTSSILWSALFIYFTYLVFSNSGLYPTVLADEYTYSKLSRLLPLSESSIPGYIYLWIYSLTNSCGDGFLNCARLLNTIFFVAASIPIFLVAKKIASEAMATFVAIASVASPISSYTAYFMPESLYFLGFWILAWSLINSSESNRNAHWLTSGTIYGCISLIKPHAIFFAPALLAYISYINIFSQKGNPVHCAKTIFAFFSSAIASKLFIGYVLAGTAGLTIFGPMYSSVAGSTVSDTSRYTHLLSLAAINFLGHLMAITLLYSLPFASALTLIIRQPQKYKNTHALNNIAALSLLIIFNLIIVTALFTASVSSSGPYETPYRLHMRYYNFALPFLFILAAGTTYITENKSLRASSIFFITILVSLVSYAAYTNITPFTPSFVDSPELRGVHANRSIFLFISTISAIALILSIRNISWAAKFYCFLVIPILVAFSNFYIEREQQQQTNISTFDIAGILTKNFLSKDQIGKVLVVGSNPAGLFRTLFHLDHAKAHFEVVANNAEIDPSMLHGNQTWLLVIGNHTLPENLSYKISMNGFTLAHIEKPSTIDFRAPINPEIVKKAYGFSRPASWGAWLVTNDAWLHFRNPLPKEFDLKIGLHSPSSSNRMNIEVHFDNKIFPIQTSGDPNQTFTIHVNNPRSAKILKIKKMKSSLPQSDEAEVGANLIGLKEITIIPTRRTSVTPILEDSQ